MLELRKASERGYADHGWLRSFHSFSFADYYDPQHVEFGALRVINEDRVAPGQGFGMHGHRDMEIITYVLEGQLEVTVGGRVHVARTGDAIQLDSSQPHRFRNPGPHATRTLWVNISHSEGGGKG